MKNKLKQPIAAILSIVIILIVLVASYFTGCYLLGTFDEPKYIRVISTWLGLLFNVILIYAFIRLFKLLRNEE